MAVKVKQHKGKWWVFIDHHNKRKAKCVSSKQAAETAARKIEAKLTLGDFSLLDEKPPCPTFAEYADRWMETYAKVPKAGHLAEVCQRPATASETDIRRVVA
jgi:hypothetical protein